mmetsp:Transcript_31177/g.26244  ORF Transcript_31177/g.26244 Transcript_31177/m.26244 type:complete len:307 (-) Transcript_31177:5-925(-)
MAAKRRSTAFGFSSRLSFFFSFHCTAKWLRMLMSTSRPPKLRSNAEASTCILPLVNATRHTCVQQWPMSRNRTCLGVAESSGRSIVFGRPQHSAVAAVSLSRRNTLSPAIMDASSTARRCASVNQHGTDTTQSGDAPLLCASAVPLRLTKSMASSCSGVKDLSSHSPPSFSYIKLTRTPPSGALATLKGNVLRSSWRSASSKRRPMRRFSSKAVFLMFELILAMAACPRERSLLPSPTMQGVLREDASLSMTSMPPLRAMAMTQFWLPKSRPHGNPIVRASVVRYPVTGLLCNRAEDLATSQHGYI